MAKTMRKIVFLIILYLKTFSCENIDVKISTSEHINLVSDNFLSFTVDPKFLFDQNHIGKDCLCMATSLSPAMLRIAGPSTNLIDFRNSTLLFRADPEEKVFVDLEHWKRFAEFCKQNKLQLVFALNNLARTDKGLWDPHTALDILSAAQEANIDNIVWQLGYECQNRTAEEYLNDLETLRVMIDTFPGHQSRTWRAVAGDVTRCLHADSKTDFAEYMMISARMMDALFLNGNATATELERLPAKRRDILLESISSNPSPLWITEHKDSLTELERAAEWLMSLGYSARSGFQVNFRELREDELFEPTLSFYMSVLFKSLVGERVLDVSHADSASTAVFAHCTRLRGEPVPGAVTIFAANMGGQMARFSTKLSRREEGGDIMQFVLTQDYNGNTIVNGVPMLSQGEIKPVVKRVRPYRTLLLNLPSRSFGFWVLTNTNVEACLHTNEVNMPKFVPATSVAEIKEKMTIREKMFRKKRSLNDIVIHKLVKNNDYVKHPNSVEEIGNLFQKDNYVNQISQKLRDIHQINEDIDENINILNDLHGLSDNTDAEEVTREIERLIKFENFFNRIVKELKRELRLEHETVPYDFIRKKRQVGGQLKTVLSKLKNSTGSILNEAKMQIKSKNPVHLVKIVDLQIKKVNNTTDNSKHFNSSKYKDILAENGASQEARVIPLPWSTKKPSILKTSILKLPKTKLILNLKKDDSSAAASETELMNKNTSLSVTRSPLIHNFEKESQNKIFDSVMILQKTAERYTEPKSSNKTMPSIFVRSSEVKNVDVEGNRNVKVMHSLRNSTGENKYEKRHLQRKRLEEAKDLLHKLKQKLKTRKSELNLRRASRSISDAAQQKNEISRNNYIKSKNYPLKITSDRVKRGVDPPSKLSNYVNKLEQLIFSDKEDDSDQKILKTIRKIKDGLKLAPLVEVSNEDDVKSKRGKSVKENEIAKDDDFSYDSDTIEDQILVKTKISDDDASISLNEKSNQQGFMKKAFEGLTSVIGQLNDKISHLWAIMNAFD